MTRSNGGTVRPHVPHRTPKDPTDFIYLVPNTTLTRENTLPARQTNNRQPQQHPNSILASALTTKRKKAATKLQRQCIAALSGLALNSTGATVRPASREAVERSLLFLAAFHWSRSVRGEASLALRRLQSKRSVPHPTVWGVKDCLKWLSCVDLDGMCRAAKAFLDDGGLIGCCPPKFEMFVRLPSRFSPCTPDRRLRTSAGQN